jgi:hypothetical protein
MNLPEAFRTQAEACIALGQVDFHGRWVRWEGR